MGITGFYLGSSHSRKTKVVQPEQSHCKTTVRWQWPCVQRKHVAAEASAGGSEKREFSPKSATQEGRRELSCSSAHTAYVFTAILKWPLFKHSRASKVSVCLSALLRVSLYRRRGPTSSTRGCATNSHQLVRDHRKALLYASLGHLFHHYLDLSDSLRHTQHLQRVWVCILPGLVTNMSD